MERYASKLKFTSVAAEPYTAATATKNGDETPVVLSFTAERWALNAEATETYVVKSFREPSATGDLLPTNYTYDELNNVINEGLTGNSLWKWNNYEYHRSYWGISPAYFTTTYPEVADDVKELEAAKSLHQKYYTRNELTRPDNRLGFVPKTSADTENKAEYFRETTIGRRAIKANNSLAAIPSVILVGKYSLKIGETSVAGNPTFYTYGTGKNGNPLIYFESVSKSDASSAIKDNDKSIGVSMLYRLLEQTTVLYKNANYGKTDDQGNELPTNYVRLSASNSDDLAMMLAAVEVADPTKEVLTVPGTVEGDDPVMKVAARQRTLQFRNDADLENIYIAAGNAYSSIVADNPEAGQVSKLDANRILIQNVGYCNKYDAGYAYFNIPVKHYGWYRTGNPNRTEGVDNATIDWNNVRVGDFGMVRNHSYDIVVNKIMGLGTGIGDGEDPIVPPAETKDYYVAYRVNILKWAVVPQQNVDL